jgi:hypothetical protein
MAHKFEVLMKMADKGRKRLVGDCGINLTTDLTTSALKAAPPSASTPRIRINRDFVPVPIRVPNQRHVEVEVARL